MDGKILEQFYRERLEERLIAYLAESHGIPLEQAMDIYYHSKLAEMVYNGVEGIQYLDHRVLVNVLEDTEPELLNEIIERVLE